MTGKHGEPTGMIERKVAAAEVSFDRRTVVRGSIALGAGLVGASALAGTGYAALQDATPGAATPTTGSVTADIVAAVNAFLGTLTDAERETGRFAFDDTEQKQRWSNFPSGAFQRAGLMWGDLGEEPRAAWLDVMRTTLSEEGYARVVAEWNADDALTGTEGAALADDGTASAGGGTPAGDGGPPDGFDGTPPAGGGPGGGGAGASFGTAYYYIAIIGEPSETAPWQWQWGGHHVTVNATIVGEDVSLTPSFIGVQPFTYTDADGNEVQPLADIEDDAFTLINALDADQQATAVLGDAPIDLVLGPGQDGRTIEAEGLPGADMTDDQKAAFLRLIGHYAGLGSGAPAAARMAEVEADLDETYLAWYGPTGEGSAAYFRVTGPRVVIEYSPQGERPGDAPGADYHVHGIYRDPSNDYGSRYTGIVITS